MALWIVSIFAFSAVILLLTALILLTRDFLMTRKPCLLKICNHGEESRSIVTGDTLLTTLQEENLPIPSPCGGKGSCLQCRVKILEGASTPLDIEKGAFSRRELESGFRLACQTKVKGDMTLEMQSYGFQGKKVQGTLMESRFLSSFVKELVFRIEDPLDYEAGSYFLIEAYPFHVNSSEWTGEMEERFRLEWERYHLFPVDLNFDSLSNIARAYSVASYPEEGGILKFNVRIATPPIKKGKLSSLPWGVCSSFLFSLKKEARVTLQGPFGQFHKPQEGVEAIFLIGGVGSSFARSYIFYLLKTLKVLQKVSLWYGARTFKEVIYREEFQDLASKFPHFSYHVALSEPGEEEKNGGWPLDDPSKTGFLYKAFESGYLKKMQEPELSSYYVCGPKAHNTHILKLLDDYGVPRENIVLDDFGF